MRRVDRSRYPVRAYIFQDGIELGFWCRVERRRFLATDVGQEMEATSKTLYTKSNIEFRKNSRIRLTREGEYNYTIDDVNGKIDESNDSAYRGNPLYETIIVIS